MPAIVTSEEVDKFVLAYLHAEGFTVHKSERSNGETGVDINAQFGATRYAIETIAYKSSGPARAKDFYEAFFRAISRLDEGFDKVVIAQAAQARMGLPQRARHYGSAWTRIGAAFPELELWLVDTESGVVMQKKWNEASS